MSTDARIIRIVSNQYTVYHQNEEFVAVAMGKLRLGVKPVVGDFVTLEYRENKWVIQEILPRKNCLIRPAVANVDQVLIVMSAANPDFSFRLVDRLIFLVAYEGIEPIIIVNKSDLVDTHTLEKIVDEYQNAGYKVFATSKYGDVTPLMQLFKDKITVLAGQSGVGKSSLLNRLKPGLSLHTQEISKALGRGKHTTRHNQLYALESGWVADTPGFSSLDFSHIDINQFAQCIPDFKDFWNQCKFRNCHHMHEPGCAVKKEVEIGSISKVRYEHYRECMHMIKEGHYD